MSQKKARKRIPTYIWVLISLLIVLSIFIAENEESIESSYERAKLSYALSCGLVDPNESEIEVLGSYSPDTQEIEINIPQDDPNYKQTIIHENCHKFLHKIGIYGKCEMPHSVIGEEFVCYMSEYVFT